MSGGVGPPGAINLPKEEPNAAVKTAGKPSPTGRTFFTLRQLNALAVAIVLSASGMVAIQDFALVIFSVIYFYGISKIAYPSSTSPNSDAPLFGDDNKFLGLYAAAGEVIGLFLPIAYIFEGIVEGDKEGIKTAAPHVFLLASQIFMEGIAYSGRFSLPVRVLVPVFYNAVRVLTIMQWAMEEIPKVDTGYGGSSARRLYVGKVLAVANMAFWSFNLFGFLLPYYMPKAFKMYYSNTKIKD